MPTRITGMNSGLDTETLINDLVKARSGKVEKLNKEKTKLTWKQEKWQDLNKKVKSLYSGTLSNLRWTTSYMKKKTKSSNEDAVSVITGENAMNTVQSLSITKLAKTGYLTGAEIETKTGAKANSHTLIKDLTLTEGGSEVAGFSGNGSFTVTANGKSRTINISDTTEITNLVSELNSAGVTANFDEKNQRIFIGARESGKAADFTITANNAAGLAAMNVLGINAAPSTDPDNPDATSAYYAKLKGYNDTYSAMSDEDAIDAITSDTTSEIYALLKAEADDPDEPDFAAAYAKLKDKLSFAASYDPEADSAINNKKAVRLAGDDAQIVLNGATFTSSSNNIEVNGLTFQCRAVADNVTITTEDDTDGIYDMIKGFLKEYNELVNEMDKLYNAESAKGYEPLTDDEKAALSEKEIEKYEDKIKASLFKKDSNLSTLFNTLKDTMASGYEVNGKKMYLSDFGINTLGYFTAPENERNAYHIDGNSDDPDVSGNEDKLKTLIATDAESVVNFFTSLAKDFYSKLDKMSTSTSYSSYGTFYDDKQMKSDLSDYESKIAEAEKKLADYEDKYYAKFAKMEKAMSVLNSNQNYLSGLFGGQ